MYRDNRPEAKLRMNASDYGVVLKHGDGPDQCDIGGAREALVFEENGVYHLFYDGAGVRGWLACLATSTDLLHWTKKGKVLDFGVPGELDSGTATSPWVFKEGNEWHMFYVGSPNTTPAPDYIPDMPYLTLKAKSNTLAGPWMKQKDVIPFRTKAGTYYGETASPGYIFKYNGLFYQFFSAAADDGNVTKRTLGLAHTMDLDGAWEVSEEPIVSNEEQIENSFMYYESTNQTWFLFTNHIGIDEDGGEYTDAIWVYWSKNPTEWNVEDKAIVLDGENCSWSKQCLGLPSLVVVGNRLAMIYDAPGGESKSHMGRDVGLAWLELPLNPPTPT